MILQALTQLYQDLAARGDIARRGWNDQKISYALCLAKDGSLSQAVPLYVEEQAGKKTVLRPRKMALPAAVTRASGVRPNFLWDNSSYLLGVDDKGKPERTRKCFEASAELHCRLLTGVDSAAAKAVLAFFGTWQPEGARLHPALSDCWEDLMKGANLVFRFDGRFVQEDSAVQAAWDACYDRCEGKKAQCLVTGRLDVPEPVHPSIRGVAGAQSSGAAIVSFNSPSLCSYGKEQSLNAPVGKNAAFAYTSALNYLLADRDNVQRIGDTTVVCWAEGAEPAYQRFAVSALFGAPPPAQITTDALLASVKRLASGEPVPELTLDPGRNFYILGLAPNAARLAVRFFCRNRFGELMRNINAHHERMRIVGEAFEYIPLWALLKETVNPKSTDKSPSPVMAGATARAIFSGLPYPAALLEAAMLRIRAERHITPGRAAILKAYYLRNPNPQCPEEVLHVSLNENSTNIPYTLGRLFAIYEAVQEKSNPGINTTIKDKYFNSAASIPATVFPILDNLCQKHLRKLQPGLRVTFDKQIAQLKNVLGETNPARLSLPEQGSFNLGYYHQKHARYQKKEENKE